MSQDSLIDRRKEMALFDIKSKRSLVNLMPPLVVHEMKMLWAGENQGLLTMQDYALITHMGRRGCPPEPLDLLLRARFWWEFHRCQDQDDRNPHMTMAHVLGRDIAKEVFYGHYIKNPYKLALLLCPPSDYAAALNLGLASSTAKLLEVVDKLKMFSADGEIKPAAADRLMRINEFFHKRLVAANAKREKDKPEPPKPEKAPPLITVKPEDVLAAELAEVEELELRKVDAFAKAKGGT
jgi:hypothetical protein